MSKAALSPLDGRYSDQLTDLKVLFSEEALMRYRLMVELYWLKHLSASNIASIPSLNPEQEKQLFAILEGFDATAMVRIKAIEARTHHDVKAVEYYLRERIEGNDDLKHLSTWIHFAATSEDINNLAYALMIKAAVQDVLIPHVSTLYEHLHTLASKHKARPMLARTHGQSASPTTFGKEMAVFAWRLHKAAQAITHWQPTAKFNGAVGNYNAHTMAFPEADWCSISAQMVQDLGLMWQPLTTQIEPHDDLAALCQAISLINTIALDLSTDTWQYISLGYLSQRKIGKDQVGSSTMPHKINPIQFENAEGNLGLANALLTFMAQKLPQSRLQRDLSDSTVLRNLGSAFGHSLLAYKNLCKGLALLSTNNQAMDDDLDQHWEVLAEAAQSLLRAHGHTDAYEALKESMQGRRLTESGWLAWVEEADLPEALKKTLGAMRPDQYIGLADQLVGFLPKDLTI